MLIGIISHKDCLMHEMGETHPKSPNRIKVIHDALKHSDMDEYLHFYEAPLADRQQLQLVHDKDYIDFIFDASPDEGYVALDPDVLMNPYTLQAALRAAGSGIMAVDLLMQNKVSAAFCNVRPPGHHAERHRAMGFCIFNNVAVAVAYALKTYSFHRAAIIDFDVHDGNGTEDIEVVK